jgi:acetyl esterase
MVAAMSMRPEVRAVMEMIDQAYPKVEEYAVADDARAVLAASRGALPVEDVARVEHHVAPGADGEGVVVRVYAPADDGAHRPGIIFFHGGGWVVGDLDSHDGVCRRLCNGVDAVVVAVHYRRAPEHRFPAAAEDAYSGLAWAAKNAADLGIDETRLAVCGDSAGGNLAAVVALMARDRHGPALRGQALVYPVIDSTASRNEYPSKTENGTGYFLTTAAMEWYRDQYLATEGDGDHPYCSPLTAESLTGLPAAYILTAEFDPLRDEGEHYGALLAAAGVPVTVRRAPGMFHGFFNMDAILPDAKAEQETLFAALRTVLHDR